MTYRFRLARPRHVGIVGSRHLDSYREFCLLIRPLLRPDDVIVSGDCPSGRGGIDKLAARFARQNGFTLIEHPVNMKRVQKLESEGKLHDVAFGIAAKERNSLVVRDSDVLFAIKCKHSRGTLDTIAKMRTKLEPDAPKYDARLLVWTLDCGKD